MTEREGWGREDRRQKLKWKSEGQEWRGGRREEGRGEVRNGLEGSRKGKRIGGKGKERDQLQVC